LPVVRILKEKAGRLARQDDRLSAAVYSSGTTRISAPIRDIPVSRLACAPLIRYWDENNVAAMNAKAKIVAIFL
jgi:hypothetical protein